MPIKPSHCIPAIKKKNEPGHFVGENSQKWRGTFIKMESELEFLEQLLYVQHYADCAS